MIGEGRSLEDLLAERIAGEAARIAEEVVRETFDVTRFDPDEVLGYMDSKEAAKFLGIPYTSFREIAPNLPRTAITPARFGYLRRELLEHFTGRFTGRLSSKAGSNALKSGCLTRQNTRK